LTKDDILFKISKEGYLFWGKIFLYKQHNGSNMAKGKLKWGNLLTDGCPKCGENLIKSENGYCCLDAGCTFFVTDDKIEELKNKFGRDDRAKSDEFEGYGENFGMD
jgi:hypothetical protein